MTTLGDIFRRYGPQYRARYGHHMSADQHVAMHAIEQCGRRRSVATSIPARPARPRAIATTPVATTVQPASTKPPKPGWPSKGLLLPVPYLLVTFTLPSELRAVARAHPEMIYPLLLRASAAALQQLAEDPRFLGGQIGMLGGSPFATRRAKRVYKNEPRCRSTRSSDGFWLTCCRKVL
jgi:hypothetical protein